MTALEPPPAADARPRALTLGFVAVITALGTLGTAFSPWLLVRQPLLLIALSPDVRHLVLVAGEVDFVPVLLVGEVRRALGLCAMYALGHFYGPLVVTWFEQQVPRMGGILRWLERQFARFGAPLLIVLPSYTMGAFAGAARTRLTVFVPAMLAGQALYITSSYYFGDAIRGWTRPLLRFVGEHVVATTAIFVAVIVAQQLWSRRS